MEGRLVDCLDDKNPYVIPIPTKINKGARYKIQNCPNITSSASAVIPSPLMSFVHPLMVVPPGFWHAAYDTRSDSTELAG